MNGQCERRDETGLRCAAQVALDGASWVDETGGDVCWVEPQGRTVGHLGRCPGCRTVGPEPHVPNGRDCLDMQQERRLKYAD